MLPATDMDRLAYALANLLAAWWRNHAQEADAPVANPAIPHRETPTTQESRSDKH